MRTFIKIAITIVITVLIFQSCHFNEGKSGISEGTMKYNITYLEDESENPIISLMPAQLNMSFKNNSVIMEVEGWMGIFKSSFIKSGQKSEAVTLLKMMNKKYCYRSVGHQGYLGFSAYNNAKIEFDDETKQILNFLCKHAKVTIQDKDLLFDIYFTDEIKIDKPNEFTPFENVPGVLLEFQIEINGIPMYLIASEIIEVDVASEIFQVPNGYKDVEREELDNIFSSII